MSRFFKADKRKNKKKGFKKPKLQKQTKETLFRKKLPKKEIGKKREFSDKKADKRFFHVFLKRVIDSEKHKKKIKEKKKVQKNTKDKK